LKIFSLIKVLAKNLNFQKKNENLLKNQSFSQKFKISKKIYSQLNVLAQLKIYKTMNI